MRRWVLASLALLAALGAAFLLLGRQGPASTGTAGDRVARPAGGSALDAPDVPTPPVEQPPPTDGTGLEVLVRRDGAPVEGAAVRAYLHRPIDPGTGQPGWRLLATATTGRDGMVLLPAAPGAYLVSARAHGLAPGLEETVRPTGEPVTRVVLDLAQPVSLAGRTVERASGEPLPAVAVALSREPEQGPRRGELPAEERLHATSDARGGFLLGPLAPGRYTLEAEAAGHARARLTEVAVPRGAPLEVRLGAAAVVEGLVLDPSGRPAPGAEVAFTGGDRVLLVTSGPSGGFAAELPPRSWRVSARRGDASAALPSPLAVAAGRTVKEVVLRLGAPAALRGVVVTSAGDPVPGATLGLSPAGEGGELGRTATGADGRFAFTGLAPGAYDLDAAADGFAPALRRGLEAGPGEAFELTVTLRGTGAVVGTVTDGEGRPVAGARLRGGRLRGSLGLVDAEAVSGADGGFRLQGLEPGRTTVRARRDDALAGAVRLVVVEEGRATRADFSLPASGTIEGTVRVAGGGALPGPVRVAIFPSGGRGPMGGRAPEPAPVDAAGRFTAVVPEGRWRLVAFGDDEAPRRLRSSPVEAEARAGATTQVELVLDLPPAEPDGGTLAVEVREPDGAPSPGAMILTRREGAPRPNVFRADETGRLSLPLASGEAARAPLSVGGRSGGRDGPLALVAPGAPAHVVVLRPAASLRGEVRVGGRPARGVRLALETGEDLPGPGQELQRELPGATFALTDLLPGRLTLVATTAEGHTGTLALALQPGQEATAVLELRPGAAVTGRVVDQAGAPVAGAFVLVGDKELGGDGTGADGRFRVDGAAPGEQAVRAFLPRLGGTSRTVSLAAGQELDVGDLVLGGGGQGPHGHP